MKTKVGIAIYKSIDLFNGIDPPIIKFSAAPTAYSYNIPINVFEILWKICCSAELSIFL